jgi:hypothetical protein
MNRLLATVLADFLLACAPTDEDDAIGVGRTGARPRRRRAVGHEDGTWGSALTCKAILVLPPLPNPKVTISIEGVTLRLTEREPERTATERVEVEPPWIGGECADDADCGFAGAFCHRNPMASVTSAPRAARATPGRSASDSHRITLASWLCV